MFGHNEVSRTFMWIIFFLMGILGKFKSCDGWWGDDLLCPHLRENVCNVFVITRESQSYSVLCAWENNATKLFWTNGQREGKVHVSSLYFCTYFVHPHLWLIRRGRNMYFYSIQSNAKLNTPKMCIQISNAHLHIASLSPFSSAARKTPKCHLNYT